MKDADRLYNSRLTRVYLEYLQHRYPELDIDHLLTSAGMSQLEVNDPAHWFTQNQVDRFHAVLMEATGDAHISREAGRYLSSSEGIGAVKRYALGFVNPANIYTLVGKLSSLLTHGAATTSRRLGTSKVEITATPFPGVKEKPYQCENRIGNFEGVGMYFSQQYATVEHPECFHRGDDCCRYTISWETSPSMLWKRVRNFAIVFDMAAAAVIAAYLPLWTGISAILGLALVTALIAIYGLHLERKDLTRLVMAQGDAAQEHISAIDTRYDNALLVQEVGQATATIFDKDELVTAVIRIMRNRLDFDRGSILLADREGVHLEYKAGYGFGAENEASLRQVRFNLGNPESRGIFVRSFRDQKPLIIEDVGKIKHQFSHRSLQLLENIKARALICVPIVYENKTLGILAVDNHNSRKKLSQSDLNLMMGLASQVAVAINNAESFRKLQKSEEKYRDIFENVSDFLYYHDLEGRIVASNRSFRKVSGYSRDELSRMHIKELMPEDYRWEFDAYLKEIKQTGRSEGSLRLERKNGTELIIEYKNSLVYDHDQPVGIRGSARDMTERWQAVKERRRLEKKLEHAKKMEAIGTLAGGVAHDLNNILSGIVSYPDLLLMDLPPTSHLREPIKTIRDSGQKAAAIVQDLLTMARRGVTVTDAADLNAILAEYLASPEHAKIMSFHPEVKIECRPTETVLNILGSPVHLAKTIMNLVSNAAEAISDSGKITIVTAHRYLDAPIEGYDIIAEGDYAVFEISDTGVGISPEDQKRIFEPFYTKKTMGRSGTGLGMSVVWATVKDHRGYIDVSSCPDEGTTFTLYIPTTRDEKAKTTAAGAVEDYMGRGEHILVVDDVKEQREIAAGILKRLGYEVASVASGEDAVAAARIRPPDLVVLDMIMEPGIDGLETYQKLLEINAGQRAIIASGYSESERVRATLHMGAGAYIKKPYLFEKIGKAVRAELDR